ncbi:MAG: hypothetical protein ACTSYB_09270 [Candidatus Helarchaeota archaeon]
MSISPELENFLKKLIDEKIKELKTSKEVFNKLSEHIEKLDMNLIKLAEAQLRTEQRLNELAEAQLRTEQRLNELAEAQLRTEQRLNELAEAQTQTENTLNKLSTNIENLVIEVRRLSDSIGYGLEDIARVMIPSWLERYENIYVKELKPLFIKLDDKEVELNLAAFGKKNGKKTLIIGECKSRIYSGDVNKFNKIITQIKQKYPDKEIIPFMFGFLVHPRAQEEAKIYDIRLIATYMR